MRRKATSCAPQHLARRHARTRPRVVFFSVPRAGAGGNPKNPPSRASLFFCRVYTYKKLKWEYFLYDFCYLVNVAAIIGIIFKKRWLQQLVFVYGNGSGSLSLAPWAMLSCSPHTLVT